ncbi:MAG: bifunctional 3,4-dihydroxy-2-butanone-4-phosphate synthase/GTP cyclohydrolase II [Bacteroidales bacterium]|nr:bifunctional 3,4-dihydroxy-2-butanone-4-phosphate synthase/GTP cyclohydrolase II [Bacteroidales bacterium]
MKRKLNSIDEVLPDLKAGKVIIVVDDEDRENEGDFICAAETITAETVNFMARYGRGLICAPLTLKRARELDLDLMVQKNTSLHETPFTVSIDLLRDGCTTGISASDRAKTIKAMSDENYKASDYGRPGHIFPLRALDGGVLERAGHTEACVDMCRIAGMKPVAALVEIMNEDGTMARLPELFEIADKFNLKITSVKALIEYRLQTETLIRKEEVVTLPTEFGDFKLHAFTQLTNNLLHLALVKGDLSGDEPVLVRVHSSCVTGDIFGSHKCDCGPQLHRSMQMVENEDRGVVLYMNQEGRGIGLLNKLKAYHLQEQGRDTVEANLELGFKDDERNYGVGAQILRALGISKMQLITNNPVKRIGLTGYGIEVVDTVPLIIEPNPHNQFYLDTKRLKMGHQMDFGKTEKE